jgi:hypothetical protein
MFASNTATTSVCLDCNETLITDNRTQHSCGPDPALVAALNATQPTLSLALTTAKQIASLVAFTDSKKSPVPALQLIKITSDRNFITATATDRYTAVVAKWGYDSIDGPEFGPVYLDPAGAKFITGLTAKPGGQAVEFSTEANGQLVVSYQQFEDYQAKHFSPAFNGKYPNVESLFDGLVVGGVEKQALNVTLLAKLAKLVDSNGKKLADTWEFTYHTDETNRPKPVLATNNSYRVLIQPALLSR